MFPRGLDEWMHLKRAWRHGRTHPVLYVLPTGRQTGRQSFAIMLITFVSRTGSLFVNNFIHTWLIIRHRLRREGKIPASNCRVTAPGGKWVTNPSV